MSFSFLAPIVSASGESSLLDSPGAFRFPSCFLICKLNAVQWRRYINQMNV